jgi:hypothetical protein
MMEEERKAKQAAAQRRYRERHPERSREQVRAWKEANPEKVREQGRRKAARLAARGPRKRATASPCVRCGSSERYPSGTCKPCTRAGLERWRAANPERARQLANARAQRSRERLPRDEAVRRNRQNNLRKALKTLGLTRDAYDAMLVAQDHLCALCKQSPNGRGKGGVLHIDHDHLTSRVRALLCGNCNTAVGLLDDDPALMRAAAAYIERHRDASG